MFFAEGVRAVLEREQIGRVVGQAHDPAGLLRLASERDADVMIACFEPPAESSGIARSDRRIPVVQLTWSHRDSDLVEAVRLGVRGFAHKDIDAAGLGVILRRVARGDAALPRGWETVYAAHLEGRTGRGWRDEVGIQLTERQAQVVQLVLDGHSTKQIGGALGIRYQTVKNHLRDTMARVGVSSRVDLCLWALDHGFESGRAEIPA